MTTAITIKYIDADEPAALYRRYPGELQPQDALIALDLESGELYACYDPEIGGGVPESVWNGRVRWYRIPCIPTAAGANALLEEIAPLARQVLDGAEIVWDGNNWVGRLNEDAEAAEEEIEQILANAWDYEHIVEWDAWDFFDSNGDDELGVTADTTDEELDQLAERHEREAESCGSSALERVVLVGCREYLESVRDRMRERVRDELDRVAVEIVRLETELEPLKTRRVELIRSIVAWGDDQDTDRALGELAGLSHTAIGKIRRQAAQGED